MPIIEIGISENLFEINEEKISEWLREKCNYFSALSYNLVILEDEQEALAFFEDWIGENQENFTYVRWIEQ